MTVTDLHRRAMAVADDADAARRAGDEDKARSLYQQAFSLERQAAEALRADVSAEPSRSVLLRSAASLAIECGNYRDAERLIATALAGNPPEDICKELRHLLKGLYTSMEAGS